MPATTKTFALLFSVAAFLPLQASAELIASVTTPNKTDHQQGWNLPSASAMAESGTAFVASGGRAFSDYGVLKAHAWGSADAVGNGGTAYVSSLAHASWHDSIVLDSPTLNGTIGRVTLALKYDWSLFGETMVPDREAKSSVQASSGGTMRLDVRSYTGQHHHYYAMETENLNVYKDTYDSTPQGIYVDATGYGYPRPDGMLYVTTDFLWGSSITLSAQLTAGGAVGADGKNWGRYETNAFKSAYWAGLSNLTSGGAAVTDFTITSTSGTDYTRSMVPVAAEVPEPASLALLALGGLAFLSRRRVSSRR